MGAPLIPILILSSNLYSSVFGSPSLPLLSSDFSPCMVGGYLMFVCGDLLKYALTVFLIYCSSGTHGRIVCVCVVFVFATAVPDPTAVLLSLSPFSVSQYLLSVHSVRARDSRRIFGSGCVAEIRPFLSLVCSTILPPSLPRWPPPHITTPIGPLRSPKATAVLQTRSSTQRLFGRVYVGVARKSVKTQIV